MLTGGAEDVTGVGSALEYSAYGFFCLCTTPHGTFKRALWQQQATDGPVGNLPSSPSPQPHFGRERWPAEVPLPLAALPRLSSGASDRRSGHSHTIYLQKQKRSHLLKVMLDLGQVSELFPKIGFIQ